MLKKQLSSLAILMILLIPDTLKAQRDIAYLEENVAFIDFRIRSLSEKSFIKEILIVDFGKNGNLPDSIAFQEEGFADDGKGNDAIAGDGIYSSLSAFDHNSTHPYSSETLVRSVYDKAIVDPSFAWKSDLDTYMKSYEPPGDASKLIITLECDVSWCACSNPNCSHCYISYPRPGCVSCPKFKNCHISITWEW